MYNVVQLHITSIQRNTENDALTSTLYAYNGDVDSDDFFIMAIINVKVLQNKSMKHLAEVEILRSR